MNQSKSAADWSCTSQDVELQNLYAFADLPVEERFELMMSFLELVEEGRRQLGVPPVAVTKALADAAAAPNPPR